MEQKFELDGLEKSQLQQCSRLLDMYSRSDLSDRAHAIFTFKDVQIKIDAKGDPFLVDDEYHVLRIDEEKQELAMYLFCDECGNNDMEYAFQPKYNCSSCADVVDDNQLEGLICHSCGQMTTDKRWSQAYSPCTMCGNEQLVEVVRLF